MEGKSSELLLNRFICGNVGMGGDDDSGDGCGEKVYGGDVCCCCCGSTFSPFIVNFCCCIGVELVLGAVVVLLLTVESR